ncbi:unnamed protein product [Caenorhabditis angaria]|uniref:Uncharacterized protein n=1 Tax=Caenorhabditis angaria TaxID=860376 RepID=A0A9P1N2X5_9PELO|nr:unnamed protein product [Caenorhabditis angaria]
MVFCKIIIFSFITIISIIVYCNKRKGVKPIGKAGGGGKKGYKSGSGSSTPTSKDEKEKGLSRFDEKKKQKTELDDDVFAELAKKLKNKEKTEKTESLKQISGEQNPLYNQKSTCTNDTVKPAKSPNDPNIRTDKTQEESKKMEVTKTQKTEMQHS